MKSKVSVIIPVFNRKELLLRCLESIHNQTYRPLEVIIVDNASTDETFEAAQKWGKSHAAEDFEIKVLSEPKRGACVARNKGLSIATGEFTLFFDSDDTMRPILIQRAVEEFAKKSDVNIVCWECDLHQLDGSVRRPPFNPDNAFEDHLVNALLRTQGYMAHTDAFRNIGGWDEALPGWNDWELGVRMLLNNPVIVGITEVLVDIYAQEVSITGAKFSSKAGCWEKSLAAVRKDIGGSSHPDKMHLLNIVTYREIILAAHYAKEGNHDLARQLKEDALRHIKNKVSFSIPVKSWLQGQLLSFAYHYTSHGGRGAWRVLRYLI